jgi:hypothetical protein
MLSGIFGWIRERWILLDGRWGMAVGTLGALVILQLALLFYWDSEPDTFDVRLSAQQHLLAHGHEQVTGSVMVSTLMDVASTMLDKRGGYLSNDIMPPSPMMDNIPNWEYGVLRQVRDLTRALRYNFSRSQSQSAEDKDLAIAEPKLNIDSEKWMFPRAETEYRGGVKLLENYLARMTDPTQPDAQFYARADNLQDWLAVVEMQLGNLASRLVASTGQVRFNTDLSGDSSARQATNAPSQFLVKTPWMEIDDIFFEARGSCWALIHFLRAVEIDFKAVLEKKNATEIVQQIIGDLEATQSTIWSPVVLNGTGFGFTANHSLALASYISQANAAIIRLQNLLEQG